MNNKASIKKARNTTVLVSSIVAVLAIGVGGPSSALAWGPPQSPTHFSGLLNDYTPNTVDGTATGAPISGAPYEMHGKWALSLNQHWTAATFSAELTMQTSEVANKDPNYNPGTGAHTHHISVTNGVVSMDWQSPTTCPTLKPAATGGFVITGLAYVTGSGSNAPFGNPSPVTICILGGTSTGAPDTASVEFSNLTLKFGTPANSHFSSLPIHGVVAKCEGLWGVESQSCKVAVQ